MFFFTLGSFLYDHQDFGLQKLRKGQWVSEPALWLKWYYCGTLNATTSSQVLELKVATFASVVSGHIKTLPYVHMYAQLFREHMDEAGTVSTWHTDLWTTDELTDFANTASGVAPSFNRSESDRDRFADERADAKE